MSVTNPQLITLGVALNTDVNPANTEYAIEEIYKIKYVKADGRNGCVFR